MGWRTQRQNTLRKQLEQRLRQLPVLPFDAHYQQRRINTARQSLRILAVALHDGFAQQLGQCRQGIQASNALQLSHQYDGDFGPLPVNLDTTDRFEQHRLRNHACRGENL